GGISAGAFSRPSGTNVVAKPAPDGHQRPKGVTAVDCSALCAPTAMRCLRVNAHTSAGTQKSRSVPHQTKIAGGSLSKRTDVSTRKFERIEKKLGEVAGPMAEPWAWG